MNSDPTQRRLLREAQEYLDRMPGAPGKAGLRDCLDTLQYLAGGSDERGRRPDGSRPSDARRMERQAMKEAAE